MLIKKIIRQTHLLLGLLSGLVVFVVAITGCLYSFEEELRGFMYKDLLVVQPQAQKLPLDLLIQKSRIQYPSPAIKNVKLKNDSCSSVEIILKNKQSIFINPYTGSILGTINKENDFFGVVLKIHRTLYLGDAGKIITGTSAAIFILMLISGIFLWFPRNKKAVKQKLFISKTDSLPQKHYDLHSVLGFYASLIIIFTALTGLVWSFKWAENTMYWLSNSKKQERKQYHSEYHSSQKVLAVDLFLSSIEKYSFLGEECFINMPEDSVGVYKVTVRLDDGGFYKKMNQFVFNQYTGELVTMQLFNNASTGDKLKATNYNIHTGKVFGITGQLLVFFASLISASLPVTGFLMWRGKRKKRKFKKY
jgi:uncharacterized iron-regulated membrane protein